MAYLPLLRGSKFKYYLSTLPRKLPWSTLRQKHALKNKKYAKAASIPALGGPLASVWARILARMRSKWTSLASSKVRFPCGVWRSRVLVMCLVLLPSPPATFWGRFGRHLGAFGWFVGASWSSLGAFEVGSFGAWRPFFKWVCPFGGPRCPKWSNWVQIRL